MLIKVQTATDEDFSDAVDLIEQAIPLAELTKGAVSSIKFLPKGNLGYMRLSYTVTGTAPTKGAILAGIADGVQQSFHNIFNDIKEKYPTVEIDVELVGDRPCMGTVNKEEMEKLTQFVKSVQAKCTNCEIEVKSGSTDCNIPHSLGIPAICVGVYEGFGVRPSSGLYQGRSSDFENN